MATYRKIGKRWRAEVCLKAAGNSIRKSETFDTKGEAAAWAAEVETDIRNAKHGKIPNKTVGDLLEKYRDEVSVTKRGEQWERARIGLLLRDPIANVRLPDLAAPDITAWRNRRLAAVTPASVRREWNLLSHAFTVATKEWHWLKANPMAEVRRPPPGQARDRLITEDEIERLLFALGYDYDAKPETQTARVGSALLFAIETGMRAGEIVALDWTDVFMDRKYLRVRGEAKGGGKTQAARRDVPLSPEAIRILRQLDTSEGRVFAISSTQTVDALFRKAKARAVIEGLHFHDTRHEAITRLAKKLDVLALARMVGHRDLRMLQVYYNESASDMAAKL